MGANVICKKAHPQQTFDESVNARLSLTFPPPKLTHKRSFSLACQSSKNKKEKPPTHEYESSPYETTVNLEGSPSMRKIQMQNGKPLSPDFKIFITQTQSVNSIKMKYQIGLNIGNGPHGTVNEALSMENGEQVAIKKVGCRPEYVETIRLYLQKKLLDIDHFNLVNYIEVQELGHSELQIVSELISGSSLESVLAQFGKLKENVCKLFIGQILQGLYHLTKKGSYHGNLKPKNIFIDKNGNVKLGDFFIISRKMLVEGPSRSKPICYLSPEYIKDQTKSSKTDVWALGCILLEMLTKEKPWKSNCRNLKHIKDSLTNNKGPEIPKSLSEFCKGFIRKMLIIKEEDRASIEELINHPFLRIREEEEKQIDKGFKKMISFNQEVNRFNRKKSFSKSKTNQQMLFVKLKTGMGNNKDLFGNDKEEPNSENKIAITTISNNPNPHSNSFSNGSPAIQQNPITVTAKQTNPNKFFNRMTTAEIRKKNEEERKKFEEELLKSLGN